VGWPLAHSNEFANRAAVRIQNNMHVALAIYMPARKVDAGKIDSKNGHYAS
jgi:hypothetical protein